MNNTGFQSFAAALTCTALWFAMLVPGGVQAQPATAKALSCESQTNRGDLVHFKCPIVAQEAAQRFRFIANFGGSHDDTRLSLKATLNGTPVVCAPGSKTSSTYEDGDISLDCRFEVMAQSGSRLVLAVQLQSFHAQLYGIQFDSE